MKDAEKFQFITMLESDFRNFYLLGGYRHYGSKYFLRRYSWMHTIYPPAIKPGLMDNSPLHDFPSYKHPFEIGHVHVFSISHPQVT